MNDNLILRGKINNKYFFLTIFYSLNFILMNSNSFIRVQKNYSFEYGKQHSFLSSSSQPCVVCRGAKTRRGMGGYIPPNNLAVSPPIDLNGYASERKLGKKCSIFDEDLFFVWSSPEFPNLNKIVVEVHPPNVKNRAKLG